MPRVCLQFVIVVFSEHTHLLFLMYKTQKKCYLMSNQSHGRHRVRENVQTDRWNFIVKLETNIELYTGFTF